MIHQRLAEWSQWFWPFFANHIWQTTLFALLAWGMVVTFRRLPAEGRHLIWLLAGAKFLAPVALLAVALQAAGMDYFLPAAAQQKSIEAATVFFDPISTAGQREPLQSHKEIFCLLTLVWGTGAALVFAGWLIRKWRLRQ